MVIVVIVAVEFTGSAFLFTFVKSRACRMHLSHTFERTAFGGIYSNSKSVFRHMNL